MWKIQQTAGGWEVVDQAGMVITTVASYDLALATLGTAIRTALAADQAPASPPGARRWQSGDSGIVLQADTGDGRDFSSCVFSWRDPNTYPLPLMLQTVNDVGHLSAVMCGWIDQLALRQDGGVDASGAFHDNEAGREAVTILEAQARMGVSVDPGQVDAEEVCTAYDADGWCTDGFVKFNSYEVIGLTMTPFPAFADAWIQLGAADAAAPEPEAVAASGAVAPPRAAFYMDEPPVGDARYVDQGPVRNADGKVLLDDSGNELRRVAIPLTIERGDDGIRRVYGHAAAWGTCHIGFRGQCVEPPPSLTNYANYHVGAVLSAEGETVPTGTLVLGLDHAGHQLAAPDARDHYAHTGMAWADVRAKDGDHGVWVCGVLRDSVTDELERVVRASVLSGDWRTIDGNLDMVGCQSVNVPGFPIARQALAAAGLQHELVTVKLASRWHDGALVSLAAAGVVMPGKPQLASLAASGAVHCAPCAAAADPTLHDVMSELAAVTASLSQLELRTRHLVGDGVARLRAQIAASGARKA